MTQEAFPGTIRGHVRELKTRSAVVGADVFLAGTSFGEITDANGDYFIDGIPVGTYKISVYAIGYTNTEKEISIANDTTVLVENFEIKERPITLSETVIEARANNEL